MTDTQQSELAGLLATLRADLLQDLKDNIAPMMETAAQSAVTALVGNIPVLGGLAATFVPAAFDEIDTLVSGLLGRAIPSAAPAAEPDPQSQLQSLQAHVAALTVATGVSNSVQFKQAKTQALAMQSAPLPKTPAEKAAA